MNLFSNAGSDKDDRSEKYEEFEVFSHLFQGVSLAVTRMIDLKKYKEFEVFSLLFQGVSLAVTRIDLKNIRSSKYFLFWETFQVASH